MGCEHRIVRLNNTSGNLWRRIDFISNLRLLSIINRNPLKDQCTKTRPSPASYGMVDDKPLDILRIINE